MVAETAQNPLNCRLKQLPEVIEELRRIRHISLPIAAMGILNYLKNMTSVVCMGRLGSLELAGGALAIGFTNITGYSVLSGLALGMEPLCSQAIGSKNLSLATSTLRTTISILLLASLPVSFIWLNIQPLMLVLRQDPDVIKTAAVFCRFVLPDLLANSILYPLRIYLRSKGISWPLMWCTFVSLLFHIPITIFTTFHLSLGLHGVAISSFFTNFINLFLLCSYLYVTIRLDPENLKTRLILPQIDGDDDVRDFQRSEILGALIKLAIPSCVAVCLEWWWYEFMTLLAGYLPEPRVALAAAAILIQTTSLMYTLPTALAAAVSTRVGNELGAGRSEGARMAAAAALGMALLASLFGLAGTTVGRVAWGRVFTADTAVLELTAVVLPVIGLCELANCPQTTSCGILRGSARPRVAAAINFYAFYLVGAPLAVILAFVWKQGFLGLCYGLLGAQLVCAMSILTVVYNTDWEVESLKARDLVGKTGSLPSLGFEERVA